MNAMHIHICNTTCHSNQFDWRIGLHLFKHTHVLTLQPILALRSILRQMDQALKCETSLSPLPAGFLGLERAAVWQHCHPKVKSVNMRHTVKYITHSTAGNTGGDWLYVVHIFTLLHPDFKDALPAIFNLVYQLFSWFLIIETAIFFCFLFTVVTVNHCGV